MRGLAAIGVAACTASSPQRLPASRVALTPTEYLERASMALRGVRPSLADLRAVAADPSRAEPIIDGYLETAEFGATIRDLHNEVLLLRMQDLPLVPAVLAPLDGISFTDMADRIYDEPLRLIEHVVMTDRPYTEIVTADYTMADPIVATVWGMAYSGSGDWEQTWWPDARASAGILASSALHARYRSAGFNFNRGRANAVSRSLLCHDFLDGDVQIDTSINLADPAATSQAVVSNPSCAACHQTLDPLASYFFGFQQGVLNLNDATSYPLQIYDQSAETGWFLTNDRPPSYFGQDVSGLDGLGKAIAADPRFARCAAQNFASYLTEVAAVDLSRDFIDQLQTSFVASGFNAKRLAHDIVTSDAFKTAASTDLGDAQGVVGYQMARPQQFRRMLLALTGYDAAELDDDVTGFRVLDGGIDSFYVTTPVHTFNATSSLVARREAYAAAAHVIGHDGALPRAERSLFTAADVTSFDELTVRAELVVLHARIYGELVTIEDHAIDETYALFERAFASSNGDPSRAWIVTLTGMLSDLRALYY